MRKLGTVLVLVAFLAACTDEHEVLMKDLNHPSPVIRAGAVKSLARLGDDEAYMLVSRSLDDRSAVVRIATVWALREFQNRDTLAPTIRASRDRDPEVREAAVSALAKRTDDKSRKALVKVLLAGEPSSRVRKKTYDALAVMGLSGERLSGEMAESQLLILKDRMDKGLPAERQRAVRQAGRSIHPGAIDVVVLGLADREQDVVIVALRSLAGRGGTEALRKIQLLLADQLETVRLASAEVLPQYGEAGLSLLSNALRDPSERVRLKALAGYESQNAAPPAGLVCPLLNDSDPRVAITAAALLKQTKVSCPLDSFEKALLGDDAPARKLAIGVLSTLASEESRRVLELGLKNTAQEDQLPLLAGLARAGKNDQAIIRQLNREFAKAMDEVELMSESWLGDKLPPFAEKGPAPAGTAEENKDPEEEDKSRLSDEELNKLYKKYGLGPSSESSPRGVSDILSTYGDSKASSPNGPLFNPVSAQQTDRVSMALDGLLQLQSDKSAAAVERALAMPIQSALMQVVVVLNANNTSLKMGDGAYRNLARALRLADVVQTQALISLLLRTGDERISAFLLDACKDAGWEKKSLLIMALGRLGKAQSVEPLVGMLKGYSAIPAARALAQIGQAAAVEPLKEALESAGPAEEMVLLMALAKLGCRDVVPRLMELLDEVEPDVRISAVRILGVLGGAKEMDAVKGLRYDLDRLVRQEVAQVLK